MANKLTRDIKEGTIVIVSSEAVSGDVEKRAFVCANGFGMNYRGRGTVIFGEWKDGSGADRIDGFDISVAETFDYWRTNEKSIDS